MTLILRQQDECTERVIENVKKCETRQHGTKQQGWTYGQFTPTMLTQLNSTVAEGH